MAISKSTQDYDIEFLDLSGVDDYERNELKSTLYDSESKVSQKGGVSEAQTSQNQNSNRYEGGNTYYRNSNSSNNNNNNRKDLRSGNNNYVRNANYQGHYQNYYHNNRNYSNQQHQQANNEGNVRNNRPPANNWNNNKNRRQQRYNQGGEYQQSDKRQNLGGPQQRPLLNSNNNYRGGPNNANQRRQRQDSGSRNNTQQQQPEQQKSYGAGNRLGVTRRTNSLNSCYSNTTETGSIDNSGSWNDDENNVHVVTEHFESEPTLQSPNIVSGVSTGGSLDQISQPPTPPTTTTPNSIMNNGNQNGGPPQQPQQQGVIPQTTVGYPGHGGMTPHGQQIFAPMQYPAAMYPTMQMLPQSAPNNVFVGNVTANVSVHGYHLQPHYAMPATAAAGGYMTAPAEMGVVQGPMDPGQQQNSRHGSGNSNRRGRGRTSSGSSGARRDFTPRPNSQQDHLAAAQPGMLDPQQPQLLTAATPAGYQYLWPYPPYYPQQTVGPGVGHPAAQHAAGSPLYLSALPVYGGGPATIGYGYTHGGVVYSMLPEQYAMPVEEKPEEVPQDVSQALWSPHPSEHHQQYQPQQMAPPEEVMIDSGIPEEYQDEQVIVDESIAMQQPQQPPMHHQPTAPPQIIHHHQLNPNVPNFTIVPQSEVMQTAPALPHFAQPPPALPAEFQGASLSPIPNYEQQTFSPPKPPTTFALDQPPPPLPPPVIEEVMPVVEVMPQPIIVTNTSPQTYQQVPPVPVPLPQRQPVLIHNSVSSSSIVEQPLALPVNTVNPTNVVAIPIQNVPNKDDAAVNKIVKATEKLTVQPKTDRFGGANNKPMAWNKKQTNTVSVSAIPAKEAPKPQASFSTVSQKFPTAPPQFTAKVETKEKEVKRENKEVTANTKAPQQAPPQMSLAPPPPPIEEQKSPPTLSWASLFNSSTAPKIPASTIEQAKRPVAKVLPFDGTTNQSTTKPIEKKPVADEYSLKLADFLQKYKIDNNSISIYPRGLINRTNYCYINAILQALVSCPPFYHLMRDMPKPTPGNKPRGTPIIDAMQELMAGFNPRKIIKEKGSGNIELVTDTAFEPTVIYKMLSGIRSDIFQVEGRQEDAEEFLGCILNRLNDEMLELIKLNDNKTPVNNSTNKVAAQPQKKEEPNQPTANGVVDQNGEASADADGDDWQVIGSRNKGTVTRTTDFGRTPISDIFRGKLKSRVHREGDHATDNIQPFFTLQLDIERATSVREALELLVGRDPLEGVTSSKTNQEVTAWQQVTIEDLPVVLVLHLKCFDYKMEGCTKILKALEFPVELKIDQKLLSSKTKYTMPRQRTYKLFAVVYHDGKEASKGHYLTDAFHIGYGSWLRYDDSQVRMVAESQVLKPQSPRVPYLLLYRRYDTINNNTNNNNSSSNNNNGNNTTNVANNNNNASNVNINNVNPTTNSNNTSNNNNNNINSHNNYHQRNNNYHK